MPGLGAVLQQGRQLLTGDEIVSRLRTAGCVFAEEEAALLVECAAGSADALESMVSRREAGEPLEVIVGWAEFCGLRIAVAPGVFVPRQRTALLIDLAAAALCPEPVEGHHARNRTCSEPAEGHHTHPARHACPEPVERPGSGECRPLVLDLCCGTGALGLALAARTPITLVAAELDPAAVACARLNVEGIGEVFEGDLFSALPTRLKGRLDVILANAPYVPTTDIALMPPEARLHEPPLALDGGDDGLAIHRRIAAEALEWMAPGGQLLIEVAEPQVPAAIALLEASGLAASVHRDDDRDAIAVVGLSRTDDHVALRS